MCSQKLAIVFGSWLLITLTAILSGLTSVERHRGNLPRIDIEISSSARIRESESAASHTFSGSPFIKSSSPTISENMNFTFWIILGDESNCNDQYNYGCKFIFYVRCVLLNHFNRVSVVFRLQDLMRELVSPGDVVMFMYRFGQLGDYYNFREVCLYISITLNSVNCIGPGETIATETPDSGFISYLR